ncbi:META domain-containing protein [uncultured Winogradskyella sp.]|uniref:META domain-containing protein n=1 Tax=uncultured Winogradskyella sp. TaxID=395353 RepID=UPI003511EAA7
MKKLSLIILVVTTLASCSSEKQKTSIFWVSGFKTNCESGAGPSSCLLISKGEDLQYAEWQNFYADIEGFQFEDGILKKIEVLETEREEPVPADASSIIYKMTKELEQKQDPRIALNGDWEVNTLVNQPLSQDTIVPTLSFNLLNMTVNGNGGCNSYKGTITALGLENLTFGELLNTLRMCEHQAMEDSFFKTLRETAGYTLADNKLSLLNKKKDAQLVFNKIDQTKNTIRLNDIWTAVRINGNPINRMVKVPQLEVNVSEMKIFGSDGCNNYFGTITELTEETIAIDGIGSTRKMCPDMEVPERYNRALSKVNSYSFDERLLVFTDKDGNEVLAFLKTD